MTPHTRRRVVEVPSRKRPPELRALRIVVEPDLDPDLSELNQTALDAYRNGEFVFVGIRAEAVVAIEGTEQTLESVGTWGIDEHSDTIDEIYDHEWRVLRGVLMTVGVPSKQLPREVDSAWIEWRT